MSRYLELLAASSQRVGSSLCVGIDPDPAHLAPEHAASVAGLRVWVRLLVTATAQYAAAYKVNLAFFEAYGAEGVALAEEIRALTPAETPIIMDVKRGDIGNTVKAQARALFDALGADAVTASPYLGIGALAPLLERDDRFVYLLCRTSNPESAELQELRLTATGDAPEEELYLRVARLAAARPEALAGRIGLVAGATAGGAFVKLREAAPSLPLLVPGVGAQGGDLTMVTQHGGATAGGAAGRFGGGLLVNVGRGISGEASGAGEARLSAGALEEAIHARAAEWGRRLAILAP
jgi:orotidine 5'-phosphate decarboxylase subfamily 2